MKARLCLWLCAFPLVSFLLNAFCLPTLVLLYPVAPLLCPFGPETFWVCSVSFALRPAPFCVSLSLPFHDASVALPRLSRFATAGLPSLTPSTQLSSHVRHDSPSFRSPNIHTLSRKKTCVVWVTVTKLKGETTGENACFQMELGGHVGAEERQQYSDTVVPADPVRGGLRFVGGRRTQDCRYVSDSYW